MVTIDEIIAYIRRNQLSNSIVCLHSSLRSFGRVQEGASTVIDGFLQEKCTVVCPAFFYESRTYPIGGNYANNGIDYSRMEQMTSRSYNDAPDQIDPSMGIIPRTILKHPNAQRTRNPGSSFAIIGEKAASLLENQSLLDAYSLYRNIYNGDLRATILLAGVDYTACTPIHFAEQRSGRTLFRRWAVYNHKIVEIEDGPCSDGFENLREHTADLERTDVIGQSLIRTYPFRAFIDRVAQIIQMHPQITHCGEESCERCNDMVRGGRCERTDGSLTMDRI